MPVPHTPALGNSCEVLIIGGGPAGSTAAALLAKRGRRVVVIEKDRHPRFHIGESLLPLNLALFERLGVHEQIEAIGMVKRGAEFVSTDYDRTITFNFADAWNKTWTSAYQVRRSEFDHILLKNASASGAEVYEEHRVTDIQFDNGGADIVVTAADGIAQKWRAVYVVDASGRDTFLASRMKIKRRNTKHASAALYGHFTNVRRLPGEAEGNISIFWFDHGWFWFIPLRDGTTSVGAVCWPHYLKSRRSSPTAFLHETIAQCLPLADRLKDAQLTGPATATGNYSYTSDRMYGPRYILIGDAFAFVDPVFSSGVYLAMNSASVAAEAVHLSLDNPTSAPVHFAAVDRRVRRGLRTFQWLIYRMTSPAIRHLFMNPNNQWGIQSAVISLLAGDVYGKREVDRRLRLFRGIYYLVCIRFLPQSFNQWRRRRAAIAHPPDLVEARG
jgi:flavin-dependent dehydrogenase